MVKRYGPEHYCQHGKETRMSDVKSCNNHGGMFPAKQPGSAKISGIIYHDPVRDGLDEEHISWDLCPECVKKMQGTSTRVDYPAIAMMEQEAGIGDPQ